MRNPPGKWFLFVLTLASAMAIGSFMSRVGMVSNAATSSDTTLPTVTAFIVPAPATTPTVPISSFTATMAPQNLAVITLCLTWEIEAPLSDLPLVNGQDDPVSTPGRIVHWDAEWHRDTIYYE